MEEAISTAVTNFFDAAGDRSERVKRYRQVLCLVQTLYYTYGESDGVVSDSEDSESESESDSGEESASEESASAESAGEESAGEESESGEADGMNDDIMEIDDPTSSDDAPKKPTAPKFPKSNFTFMTNGPRITETFEDTCMRLAEKLGSSKKGQLELNWTRKLLIFLSKVFGKPGFEALQQVVRLLRRGLPSYEGPLQITGITSDFEAQVNNFVRSVQFAMRMNTAWRYREYALCQCSIALAKLWGHIKQSINNNDVGWAGVLKHDNDIKTLREQSKKRNNIALSFGWLTLRAYPSLKDENGAINTEAFNTNRDRLQNDIAAGEHLRIIQELLGGSVFLLFVPGWKRLFRNGRYDSTRDTVQTLLRDYSPDLPQQIGNLQPIYESLLGAASAIPVFAFEAKDALQKNNPSLESLLTTTDTARSEELDPSGSDDEDESESNGGSDEGSEL